MKNYLLRKSIFFLGAFIFSLSIFAQDKESEITVKITQDGKVVKDTTYVVEDESVAKMIVKMLDMTLGADSHKKGSNMYAFKSKDGKVYEIKSGDAELHTKLDPEYFKNEDGNITVIIDENGKTVIEEELIFEEESDGKKEKEVIIINKDGKLQSHGKDIEWIEEGDHKVLIIDNEGKEKIIKILKDDNSDSDQEVIIKDGKKIIIKEMGEKDKKEIKVEVIVDEEKQVEQDEKPKKKEKKKK